MKYSALMLFAIAACAFSQFPTPLERSDYKQLTTNADLIAYVRSVADAVPHISMDAPGYSLNGKMIPVIVITTGEKRSAHAKKITLLIFAQQHGNEPSGKEGALLLLKDFADGILTDLLDKVNVILVPQMNPDGSDSNTRRNGRGMDLNRNHMIMTEPEVIRLHEVYKKYDPEMTLDVHEYNPFGESWKEFGFREDADETVGTMTNINISAELRALQREQFLPFIRSFVTERGFSFSEYNVGGPPNKERIRNSTVDVNDGRQSFGILGSFSFILEGKNGRDSIDNIKHRAEGQCAAMTGFITFAANNAEKLLAMTAKSKKEVQKRKEIAVQMEHVGEGEKTIHLLSYATGNDTALTIANYHTIVEPKLTVKQPKGYLIPKNDTLLVEFLKKHYITHSVYRPVKSHNIMHYVPVYGPKPVFEEFELPVTSAQKEKTAKIIAKDYFYVPIEQRQSSMMTLAFEPQSMINLLQYEKFAYLMKEKIWPILRVE